MSAATYWKRLQELTRGLYAEPKRVPLEGVLLAKVANLGDYSAEDTRNVGASIEEGANVLTSIRPDGSQRVVLDLDVPAQLLASSTEGHSHLLIDVELDVEGLTKLLDVLAELGIVEEGYRGASLARGYTAVRLPWVAKEVQA